MYTEYERADRLPSHSQVSIGSGIQNCHYAKLDWFRFVILVLVFNDSVLLCGASVVALARHLFQRYPHIFCRMQHNIFIAFHMRDSDIR